MAGLEGHARQKRSSSYGHGIRWEAVCECGLVLDWAKADDEHLTHLLVVAQSLALTSAATKYAQDPDAVGDTPADVRNWLRELAAAQLETVTLYS